MARLTEAGKDVLIYLYNCRKFPRVMIDCGLNKEIKGAEELEAYKYLKWTGGKVDRTFRPAKITKKGRLRCKKLLC